ncbi:hypothetical protein JCM16303_006113 [Sporobolomyces ruberrimus]
MCRWIVYFSHEEPILLADLIIRPAHALIKQVDEHYLPGLQLDSAPTAANDHGSPNMLTNIDGFGVGWYSEIPSYYKVLSTPSRRIHHPDVLPVVYKCVSPPLHDLNLHSMAHSIESRVVFGHIRASTTGTIQESNCHPFQWGRFLFQHNGHIGSFADIQLDLMNLVGARARSFVKGTTDTEWLAALFFHCLDPSPTATWLEDFPLSSQLSALYSTITTVIELVERAGGYAFKGGKKSRPTDWFSANLAITDGSRLIALRYAYTSSGSTREAPSLYYSTAAGPTFNRKYRGHPDGGASDVGGKSRTSHEWHVVVASEPMTWDEREWRGMKEGEVLVVDRGEEARLMRFEGLKYR